MRSAEDGIKTEFLNYRPPFFAAVSLVCGISASALLRTIWWAEIILAVLTVASFIFGVFVKKKTVALICGWAAAGVIAFYLYYAFTYAPPVEGYGIVTGRVSDVMSVYSEGGRYLLTDVFFNGEKVSGHIEFRTSETLSVADKIVFQGRLFLADVDPFDSYGASLLGEGVRYNAASDVVTVIGRDALTFTEKVKAALNEVLTVNTGTESAGMIMGLMLGERGGISGEVYDTLSASGISHVLSVSGLHVSFMAGMVYAFMRLIKRPSKRALIPLAVILPLYCVLTGFQPGVIRASVTTFVFLIALSAKARYDALNALSASAIIILLCMPWSLFDLSFQMSYAAVLGIILFYRPIRAALAPRGGGTVRRIARRAAGVAALSLSANALLLGISLSVFGSFAVYFLPANFIAVPLASLIYVLAVPLSFIAVIIPAAGILLTPLGYLTELFIDFSALFAGLPGNTLKAAVPVAAAVVYCFGLVFGSGLNLMDKKYRYGTAALTTAFFVGMLFTG